MKTYSGVMEKVLEKMPESDRKDFLSKYRKAMARHSLIRRVSEDVNALLNKQGKEPDEIDFTNYFAVLERVFEYTGKEIKPEVRVPGLSKTDFAVSYRDNIEPGTAKALIAGKGKYKGTITESFKILKKDEPAIKKGWVKTAEGWKYRKADGSFAKGWLHLGDRWFYLGSDGIMKTGWQDIDGERYYFDEEGVMQTGWREIDGVWYYFSESGALRK